MSILVSKVKLLLFGLTLVLVSLAYPHIATAQYGDYGVRVDFQIITGSKSSDFYVGDTFHYNITLTNIGTQPIDSDFTVSLYNPSRELLGTRIFQCGLSPGQVTYLFPAKEKPVVQGQLEYDIFFFDSLGSYKLLITSSQSLLFWRFSGTEYTYQSSSFPFYFDAMPRWDKTWRDRLAEWQTTNEALGQQTLTISKLLYRLTYLVGFLTVVNLAITYYSGRRSAARAFVLAVVGLMLVLFVMEYLDIHWI